MEYLEYNERGKRDAAADPGSLALIPLTMPTVALIGPELFPIPPIRGGATELFIDSLAAHLTRYRPVVIGPADPDLPNQEKRGRVAYRRVPLNGLQQWLYRRYRHLVPLYDPGRRPHH